MKNWKNVDVATRDVVLQNIAVNLQLIMSNSSNSYNNIFIIHIHFILHDQFELEGDSNLVTKTLNTKCRRLLSSNSYKLHQAYKKLKQSHGADYARSHPQMNATLKQWTKLIDGR